VEFLIFKGDGGYLHLLTEFKPESPSLLRDWEDVKINIIGGCKVEYNIIERKDFKRS